MMKLLLLGGTVFLGHHVAEAAISRGHEVTLFTRGKTNPGSHPGTRHLIGDRDGNLSALEGRSWDVIIDTSGYVPRLVEATAKLLADQTELYVFISSISVYRDMDRAGLDETAEALPLPEDHGEVISSHYGALKASCEQTLERLLPGRTLIVRPGLIVGPNDPTDRFTYWPARIERGGEVLAPAPQEAQVQFIDVRDLAAWIVSMAEARRTGVFNATGPSGRLTMGALLEAARSALNPSARLAWADEQFLVRHGVGAWVELPLWIPDSGEHAAFTGMMRVNASRAEAAGLRFRPLADTLRDTAAWNASRPALTERRAGLSEQREAELLLALHSSSDT